MPYTVDFKTGESVDFDNEPTPKDIDEVATKLGINKPPVAEPKRDGLLSTILKDPLKTLVVKPAIRTSQALASGAGALIGGEYGAKLQEAASQPLDVPIGFGGTINVEPQKAFGLGGVKQITGDALKSASYITTGGTASGAASSLFKGQVRKATVGGMAAGAQGGALAGSGDAIQQEESGVGDVAGGALTGGLFGGVAGGLLGFGGASVGSTARKITPYFQRAREEGFVPAAQKQAVDSLENKYYEWTGATKSGKVKQGKTEAKTERMNQAGTQGRTPMRVLAEDAVVPQTSGTKFDTFNQSNKYRKSIEPLQDAADDGVREVGRSTGPLPLSQVEARALRDVNELKVPEGDRQALIRDIQEEFILLRNKYGDNIRIEDLNGEKKVYWSGTKFDSTKPFKSDAYYRVAKSAQKTIEDTADGVGFSDVAQLNREIGDRLEAAKTLENLNGQTLKGGRLSKIAGVIIGSGVSSSIPGKLAGMLGGNLMADLLIKSNVSNPVRRLILKSLEKRDPQAYKLTLEWLEKQGKLRDLRLLLSAPSGNTPDINQGRAIPVMPTGSKAEYVGRETVAQSLGQSLPINPIINKNSPNAINVASIDTQLNQPSKDFTNKNAINSDQTTKAAASVNITPHNAKANGLSEYSNPRTASKETNPTNNSTNNISSNVPEPTSKVKKTPLLAKENQIKNSPNKRIGLMDNDESYTPRMDALIKEAQQKGESFPYTKMTKEEQGIVNRALSGMLEKTPVTLPKDFKPYVRTITGDTVDVKKFSDPAYLKAAYESTFARGGTDEKLYKILTKELVPKGREASGYLADLYSQSKKTSLLSKENQIKKGEGVIPKTTSKSADSLTEEAKKYKSAEEFVDSLKLTEQSKSHTELQPITRSINVSEFGKNIKLPETEFGIKTDSKATNSWEDKIKNGERPVVYIGGEFMRVVDGANRLQAYKNLGYTEIPTVFKSQLTDIYNKANAGRKTPLLGKENQVKKVQAESLKLPRKK